MVASSFCHDRKSAFREVSFFTGRGALGNFLSFVNFSDPPYCMSKIFLIPPEALQNLSDPPPYVIIKARAEIVSVFEAESDYALGLLKVKAGNLRGILTVI